MATIRDILDNDHIDAAAARAADKTPNKPLFIYADDRTTGLQIRCQGKQAFWNLRYGDFTKTLGYVYPDTKRHVSSVTEAREIAQAAKEILDDDPEMLEPFLAKYYAIRDSYKKKSDAVKAARVEMRSKPTTWTLRQCLQFMIEHRQSESCKKEERVGKYAIQEWSLTLRRPALQKLFDKPVVLLKQGHFDAPREQMAKDHGIDPANKAISNIRSCLDYCMRVRSLDSGLDNKDQWWQLIESAGTKDRQTRTPTVDDIVRILIIAEEYLHKPLPGRSDYKHGVRDNVFAALWWLVLTAQRTYAGLHIKHIDFIPDPERPESGWYLAQWAGEMMKAGKLHILPIPPRVVKFMQPLIDVVKSHGESEWIFPSERGTEDDDKTVGQSGVRQCLQRLAANDPLSKDEKGNRRAGFVDLFAENGIPWWTPHDLRRTIGSVLDKAGIPGGSSVILAHNIDAPKEGLTDKRRADWMDHYVQNITRSAYHDPVMLNLKSKAMEIWTNAVLDRYEELSPRAQQRIQEAKSLQRAKFIFDDANSAERAREDALEAIRPIIASQKAKITKKADLIEKMKAETTTSLGHISFATEELEDQKHELKRLENAPGMTLIKLSEDARSKSLAAVLYKGYADYDFRNEAPEYIEIRDRYITGKITYDEFKEILSDKYGYDFAGQSYNMYLPGRDPRVATYS